MKNILLASIAVTAGLLVSSALADDLSVFRVCQDQRVLHTSDGADAGHIEYIVMDPGSDRIVSAVVTGGVIADRHVAIPIEAMRFGADREITFTNITRETIVSAPVVETSTFSTAAVIHPEVIERTYTHFGYNPASIRVSANARFDGREGDRGARDLNRGNAALEQRDPHTGDAATRDARDAGAARTANSTTAGQSREANATAEREAAARERNAAQNRNGLNDRDAATRGTTQRAATQSEAERHSAAFGGTPHDESQKSDSAGAAPAKGTDSSRRSMPEAKSGSDVKAAAQGKSTSETNDAPSTPSKYKSAVSEGQSREQSARPESTSGNRELRGKSSGEEKSAASATKSSKPAGAESERRSGSETGRGERQSQ